jgi:Xaa-Pro aminopeptidase
MHGRRFINTSRAIEKLAAAGCDALVGADARNVLYLSGVRTFDTQWALPEPGTAVIVPARDTEDRSTLCIGAHYIPYLLQEPTWVPRVRCYDWFGYHTYVLSQPDPGTAHSPLREDVQAFLADHHIDEIANDIVEVTANALVELGLAKARVAFDDLRLAAHVQRRLPELTVIDGHDLLTDIQKVSTPDEIALMQEGASINQRALEKVIEAARPGVRWEELAHIYRVALAERGAVPTTDKGLMWGSHYKGEHIVDSFYLPRSDFALEAGRAYIFETYSIYKGYTCDGSRTIYLGDPPAEYRRIVDAVMRCYEAIETHLRPGQDSGLVYQTVMEIMGSAGIPTPLKTATATHGVGLQPVGWYVPYPAFTKIPQSYMLEGGQVMGMDVLYYGHAVHPFHFENQLLITADGPRSFFTKPQPLPKGLLVRDGERVSNYCPPVTLRQEQGIDLANLRL